MKVLLAEDDEHGCDVLTRRLQRAGHAVTAATSCAELHSEMREGQFDVVLLCFSPHEHNSWKVASELRSLSDVPIIAVSSVPFRSDRTQALNSGCQAYLPKPIDFKELVTAMGRVTAAASGSA